MKKFTENQVKKAVYHYYSAMALALGVKSLLTLNDFVIMDFEVSENGYLENVLYTLKCNTYTRRLHFGAQSTHEDIVQY